MDMPWIKKWKNGTWKVTSRLYHPLIEKTVDTEAQATQFLSGWNSLQLFFLWMNKQHLQLTSILTKGYCFHNTICWMSTPQPTQEENLSAAERLKRTFASRSRWWCPSFPIICYWHGGTQKNKMKPTNPNADTYVDKQRQYLFITFPANSLVRHPEFTHWCDTLVGHPCLTLLRNALVRHFCLTLLWDTLVRHFLLDTLVRHSYLTFL